HYLHTTSHSLFFSQSAAPEYLPSSPTRRSSDLESQHEGQTIVGESSVRTNRVSSRQFPPVAGRPEDFFLGQPRGTSSILRLGTRSEEHTSELQSLTNLVCRLLLEKKKIYELVTT